MAWFLTSAYKPDTEVTVHARLYNDMYASITHPDYETPIIVSYDQLVERELTADDLL